MTHLMPNLQRTIQFLRDAARAPSTDWPSYVKALKELPRVSYEGGEAAMSLASSARAIVRQLIEIRPEGDAEMRRVLKALADVLQIEFDARFVPPHYVDRG